MDQQTKTVKAVLAGLIEQNGEATVEAAVAELLKRERKQLPLEAHGAMTPQSIVSLIAALDTTVGDLLVAGQKVAEAYSSKAELSKRFREIENEIKITEATALMETDGKTAVVNGKTVALNNGEQRDAYRRLSTKDLRNERAVIEGDIARIDVLIQKANTEYNTIRDAGAKIEAKANIYAGLLHWDSKR
jgi:hypothetical protein